MNSPRQSKVCDAKDAIPLIFNAKGIPGVQCSIEQNVNDAHWSCTTIQNQSLRVRSQSPSWEPGSGRSALEPLWVVGGGSAGRGSPPI